MYIVLFIIINQLCLLVVLSWVIVVRITNSLVAALVLAKFSEEDVVLYSRTPLYDGHHWELTFCPLWVRCPSFLCFTLAGKAKQRLALRVTALISSC